MTHLKETGRKINYITHDMVLLSTPPAIMAEEPDIRFYARWKMVSPQSANIKVHWLPNSMETIHKFVTLRCVFILVQLNKCVVCGCVFQTGHSGDGGLSTSILFKECRVGHLFFSELGQGTTGYFGECYFGIMYVEWYDVRNFVVISPVNVYAIYGGMCVFHVCFDLCVVYDVGFVLISVVDLVLLNV